MATAKQATPRKSAAQVKPMPFPGESPTVSLALAAGRQYGPHEEAEKPAGSRQAARPRPKKPGAKKTASGKKSARA